MTGAELYNIIKKNKGMGGSKPRAYCGMKSGAWCCAYVCYGFNQGGQKKLFYGGKKVTYCPTAIQWCKANLAEIPLYLAMPCDIIFFDWQPNGTPDHIGFVKNKISTSEIETHEGNTSGGIVDEKERTIGKRCRMWVFRPHFTPTGLKKEKLATDGSFGYKSIFMLQTMLGIKADGILGKQTVKKLQAYVGVAQDGSWGKKTSLATQKKLGFKGKDLDGAFGAKSVRALQSHINAKVFPSTNTTKPSTPSTVTKPTTPSKPKATLKSYRIEVDLTNQIATVYGVYSDGKKKGIMSEWVSTARKGKSTPTGNFKIQGASGGRKAKLRTAKMSGGKSYAEYLCRFHGAKCMHTVPYKKRQKQGMVNKDEFNKLGTPRSAGCVRMPNKLAKYIYNNCPIGTPVVVFKGKAGVYPMGKPKKYTATSNYDPTR